MNGESMSVAVIGMNARFPEAESLDSYWANLRAGTCSIKTFTEAELLEGGVAADELANPHYVPAKGHLADADRFEADFFGFSHRDAQVMDPQHRVLLETAWGAFEDAGYDPARIPARVGVFVGGSLSEHAIAALGSRRLAAELGVVQVKLLADKDYLASWISYQLGLTGPCMTVQTACSTSLAAVHLAVSSLLNGECDIALAGAVAIDSVDARGYLFYENGIGSRDGRCRPFDKRAGGAVGGNGAGLVVLRRLDDAVAHDDAIRAVVRGSALNNDGREKVGFTATSVVAQTAVIVEAWAAAGITPDSLQYVEAHGTGTALGDPIEVHALADAFGQGRWERARCGIGSVKSNIGHLDAAAGIAGLIKVVLMLENGELAPMANVTEAHPELRLDTTPFYLVTERRRWPRPAGGRRRAAVSSFGLGGTNVHLVAEEAPDRGDEPGRQGAHLLPISAHSDSCLRSLALRMADACAGRSAPRLTDVSHTLMTGRAALGRRAMVVAEDGDQARTAFARIARAGTPAAEIRSSTPVFLLPGHGGQYPAMGAHLYDAFPAFRAAMDRCAEILLDRHGLEPRSWMVDPATVGPAYWQPALVSMGYAAAHLWLGLNVNPSVMLGHSLGEYVVACLAGVLGLEDALHLAVVRGDLIARTPPGHMLAVSLDAADAAERMGPHLDIAAVNGPSACVVSGSPSAVAEFARRLTAERHTVRRLNAERAFHSRSMDGILDDFERAVSRVDLRPPATPYVSTLTGDWVDPADVVSARYWRDQIRRPVQFHAAVATAAGASDGLLLELGPDTGLATLARRGGSDRPAVATMAGTADGADEVGATLQAVGTVWAHGCDLTWEPLTRLAGGRRTHLPTYPFHGPRYGTLRRPEAGSARAPGVDIEPVGWDPPVPHPAGTVPADAPGDPQVSTADPNAAIDHILATALGLATPGSHTFLGAGGDSLLAVHIIGRLRDELGIEAPISALLDPIPLTDLAAHLRGLSGERMATRVDQAFTEFEVNN